MKFLFAFLISVSVTLSSNFETVKKSPQNLNCKIFLKQFKISKNNGI